MTPLGIGAFSETTSQKCIWNVLLAEQLPIQPTSRGDSMDGKPVIEEIMVSDIEHLSEVQKAHIEVFLIVYELDHCI